MAAAREGRPQGGEPPSEEEIAALTAAEDERTIKWEAVLLLGSSEVVVAARRWHQAVFRLQRLAYGKTSDMSLAEAIGAVSQARRSFYEAAKADIGIDVGRMPEAYEWQLSKAGIAIDASGELNWFEHMTGQATHDASRSSHRGESAGQPTVSHLEPCRSLSAPSRPGGECSCYGRSAQILVAQ